MPNNDFIIGGTGTELKRRTASGVDQYYQYADLGEVPQAYKQLYQQLFNSNPYRNLHYNKSNWQNFLSKLGFRTDADRWDEQVQENAAQWDAGVYQQMYQDEYNSETAKAQRMRAAGENPDLLGTGSVSEAASPFQDPAGLDPGSTEEGVLGQVSQGIISAFNGAFGIATQFLQLQGLASDVEGKNISNAENMMNIITQRVLGMTPAEGFKTDAEFGNWKRATELKLRTQYGQAFFKGSSRRRWNRSIDDFIGGLPQSKEQYAEWKDRLGNAKDYLRGRETWWDESIEVFKEINDWYIGLQKDIEENEQNAKAINSDADVEAAGNELEYQQTLEPDLKAQDENETHRRRISGETFEGILNKHLSNLGQRLDNLSKQGGLKGLIGEVILLLMTMKFNMHVDKNGNPSFSMSPPQPN